MSLISSGPVPAGDSARVLPAPAGRMRQELAELDDRELLDMAGSLPRSSQRRAAACELLVGRHRGLVRACVQRYRGGLEPAEDLMQVGYVGLVKAINSFDPAAGHSLAAYAWPCITGEIKRHFRDKRWQVHVTRAVKELAMQARAATWQLTQELGHTPAQSELAGFYAKPSKPKSASDAVQQRANIPTWSGTRCLRAGRAFTNGSIPRHSRNPRISPPEAWPARTREFARTRPKTSTSRCLRISASRSGSKLPCERRRST